LDQTDDRRVRDYALQNDFILVPNHARFVEYHVLSIALVVVGIIISLREKDYLWLTSLGCFYIFGSFIFWYFRESEARNNADIAPLSFTIILNKILYEGYSWFVVLFICTCVLFTWILATYPSSNHDESSPQMFTN
jgi:hypothetical protein